MTMRAILTMLLDNDFNSHASHTVDYNVVILIRVTTWWYSNNNNY